LEKALQEDQLGLGFVIGVMLKIRVLGYFNQNSCFLSFLESCEYIGNCGKKLEIDAPDMI